MLYWCKVTNYVWCHTTTQRPSWKCLMWGYYTISPSAEVTPHWCHGFGCSQFLNLVYKLWLVMIQSWCLVWALTVSIFCVWHDYDNGCINRWNVSNMCVINRYVSSYLSCRRPHALTLWHGILLSHSTCLLKRQVGQLCENLSCEQHRSGHGT